MSALPVETMSANPSQAVAPGWALRPMHRADLEAVDRIEREIYPFPWNPDNFSDSLRASYDAWVLESDHAMLGYAIVMWIPDEIHLLNLSVAAPYQRKGYGRAMLDWLCKDGARRGARSVLLEVRPSNGPARALYQSMGFAQIGVRKRYYPSYGNTREDALVLHRTLIDG